MALQARPEAVQKKHASDAHPSKVQKRPKTEDNISPKSIWSLHLKQVFEPLSTCASKSYLNIRKCLALTQNARS